MAKAPVHIKLNPNRCDRCRRCMRVCEPDALKIGPAYIYLDWRLCDECMACVEVCETGAITRLERSRKDARVSKRPGRSGAGRISSGERGQKTAGRAASTPVARPRPAVEPAEHPVPAESPVTWKLAEALAVLMVAFAALFGKDALLSTQVVIDLPASGRVIARVAVLGSFYIVQFAVLAYLARRNGRTALPALGLSRVRTRLRSWLSAAGWVTLLLVVTRLAAWVWGTVSRAVGFDPPQLAEGAFSQVFGAGLPGLTLSVLLVVLVAPLAEEAVFRGVVLRALGARWGTAVGLFGSSALFAVYHLTAWQIVPVFILGIACGWLTQHRGSLWPAVVLHALYNAVPVALAFLVVSG